MTSAPHAKSGSRLRRNAEGSGLWALEASSELNANVVRFGAGEHINDEVDVVFVGVSGWKVKSMA